MTADNLIPIIIFSIVILYFIVWCLKELKRGSDLNKLAARLNMDYEKKPGPFLADQYKRFKLASRGRGHKITRLMKRSVADVDTACFEYKFVTGHGKNSKTHRQTVISISSPELKLPAFVMEPEHLFMKVAQKFSEEDIDFDTHPKFSKLFQLTGHNEDAIRALFTDEVLRFFEDRKGLCVETKLNQIIVYRKKHRVPVKQLADVIKESLETMDLLKRNTPKI